MNPVVRSCGWRALSIGITLFGWVASMPADASAQLSDPCGAECAAVLVVSAYAVGTGGMVAWGRHAGGFSRGRQAVVVWTVGFGLAAAGGLALSADGPRQERAVYAAGLGLVAGSAIGYATQALRPGSDGPSTVAGTLIGAGAGALIGGVYGALSHDGGPLLSVPLLTVGLGR